MVRCEFKVLVFLCRFPETTPSLSESTGPPSSIVANIYLQGTETTALTTTSHPPKVWERHVNDVFSIIRNSSLHDFFQHINSLHPKTKFTLETEQNSQLLFLDTLIQRNSDNTISVRVYRKPTHTDQSLNSHLTI